jgi:hypothetical protein
MGRTKPDRPPWWVVELDQVVPPLLDGVDGVAVWRPARQRYVLFDGVWRLDPVELLPGYALVSSELGWRAAEAAIGARLMRLPGSGRPVCMPPQALERLASVESGGADEWVVPVFQVGQRVMVREVVRSSYAGMGGEFVCPVPVRGGWFADVILEVVGCKLLPLDHLEAMDGRVHA